MTLAHEWSPATWTYASPSCWYSASIAYVWPSRPNAPTIATTCETGSTNASRFGISVDANTKRPELVDQGQFEGDRAFIPSALPPRSATLATCSGPPTRRSIGTGSGYRGGTHHARWLRALPGRYACGGFPEILPAIYPIRRVPGGPSARKEPAPSAQRPAGRRGGTHRGVAQPGIAPALGAGGAHALTRGSWPQVPDSVLKSRVVPGVFLTGG